MTIQKHVLINQMASEATSLHQLDGDRIDYSGALLNLHRELSRSSRYLCLVTAMESAIGWVVMEERVILFLELHK